MDNLTSASMGTIVSNDTVQVLQQQHHELQTQPKEELVQTQQEMVNLSEQIHDFREIVSIPKEVLLISLVSQEPALYNPKHELYRNTVQKDQKWLQISENVGWPESQCKAKWKAMRDQYCRELKRSKLSSKASIKWKYFKELDFLRPFALSRNYRPRNLNIQNCNGNPYSGVKEEKYTPCDYPPTQIKIEDQIAPATDHMNVIHQHQIQQDDRNTWGYVTGNSGSNNNEVHQQTSADDVLNSFVQQMSQTVNGETMEQNRTAVHMQHQNIHPTQQQQQQQTAEEEDDDPIHTFLNIESYFEKELISMIQLEDMLYNSFHQNYRNTKMKLEVWEEIARRLKKTVKQCRLKWKALRDQYIREHKRLKTRDNAELLPRWKHYDALSFLQKYIRHKSSEPDSIMNSISVTKTEVEMDTDDHMTSSVPSPAPGNSHSLSPDNLTTVINSSSDTDNQHHIQQHQHQHQLQQQQLHPQSQHQQEIHIEGNVCVTTNDCDQGMDISDYIIGEEEEDQSTQRYSTYHTTADDELQETNACQSTEKCSNHDSSQSMHQHIDESHDYAEVQQHHQQLEQQQHQHHQQHEDDMQLMATVATNCAAATPTGDDSVAAFSIASNLADDDEVGAFFRAVAMKIRNAKMTPVAFTDLQIDILRVINGALKNH